MLRFLSLVEYFKLIGSRISREIAPASKRHTYVSNAVDVFTAGKCLLVVIFWAMQVSCNFITCIVWYLIVANLHTYIYYFLWKPDSKMDHERSKKRFVKLVLAVMFSNLSFAYLFQTYYHNDFSWSANMSEVIQALCYSISNSMAGNYEAVAPITESGQNLMMVQYLITFLFVGVLISKAIPQQSEP